MESGFCFCDTPLGPLRIAEGPGGIVSVGFAEKADPSQPGPLCQEAARQLGEYFAGERTAFDLSLQPEGTAFQRAVWRELTAIPYGETRSYGEIARRLGREKAARAVGQAIHRNPLLILVPCHRVIGKNGALTGFAAGLDRKQALLRLEEAHRT